MDELETKFQHQQAQYDKLVADALKKNDQSALPAIAAAKQKMRDTLSEMLEISAKTSHEEQQQELIRRIMEIQRDYNGLLTGTDKMETLRRIHQTTSENHNSELGLYGTGFFIASLALVALVMRTH
jgi:hypothetical protein